MLGEILDEYIKNITIFKNNLLENSKNIDECLDYYINSLLNLTDDELKLELVITNLKRNYENAVKRLHSLGIMINGSFVFGLDYDDKDVFKRTVEWGVRNAITTSTYHILTPYPGTRQNNNKKLGFIRYKACCLQN